MGVDGLAARQQFTSKERDVETGLDYFGARYHSSMQGRFTAVDPLLSSGNPGIPQSWNRYSYCINNPLKFIDPEGLVWGYKRNEQTGTTTYQWFDGDEVGEGFTKVTNFYVEGVIDGKLVGLTLNPKGPYSFWQYALMASTALKFVWSSDDFFVKGYKIGPTQAQLAERMRGIGGIDMMPNQAFDAGLFLSGIRGLNLARPVTFYRGTTMYDALETVGNQAINAERLAARQTGATLDFGEGLYMSRSAATAREFAQAQGAFGRQGGPGVLEMSISRFRFNQLQQSFGAVDRATISSMPGHTQTFIPSRGIDFFNKHATFRFPE